jgi:tetratricopeptide (TPR) repeat protein
LYIGKTFAWYLILIFWPFGAIKPAYYQAVPISNTDVMALTGLVTITGCFMAGAVQQHLRRIGWAALILVIVLLPVLNIHILPIHDNIVDLRFAYFPAAMAVLLVTSALATIAQSSKAYWNRIFIPVALLWITIGALNVRMTLPLWRNDFTFWTWFIQVSPQSNVAYLNYSNVLMRYGKYQDAIHYAHLAIDETRIVSAGPWINMGISQIYLHDFAQGITSLQTALDKTTSAQLQAKVKSHIAKALISQGHLTEAAQYLSESITLYPDHLHGYAQLARLGWITKNQAMFDNAITNIQRITGNNAATTKAVLQEAEVPDNAAESFLLGQHHAAP